MAALAVNNREQYATGTKNKEAALKCLIVFA
jgi:hypothetical protein